MQKQFMNSSSKTALTPKSDLVSIKLESLPPNIKKIFSAVCQDVPNDVELGELIRRWSFEK
jgi:hypothetical protein